MPKERKDELCDAIIKDERNDTSDEESGRSRRE